MPPGASTEHEGVTTTLLSAIGDQRGCGRWRSSARESGHEELSRGGHEGCPPPAVRSARPDAGRAAPDRARQGAPLAFWSSGRHGRRAHPERRRSSGLRPRDVDSAAALSTLTFITTFLVAFILVQFFGANAAEASTPSVQGKKK